MSVGDHERWGTYYTLHSDLNLLILIIRSLEAVNSMISEHSSYFYVAIHDHRLISFIFYKRYPNISLCIVVLAINIHKICYIEVASST